MKKEPVPKLTTYADQFTLTPEEVYGSLFKQCNEKWQSPDPYGWNTALLHLIRNAPDEMSFFACFSTFISKLIDADVSDLVAYTLTAGSMIGLNKDDEETQKARLETTYQSRLSLKMSF